MLGSVEIAFRRIVSVFSLQRSQKTLLLPSITSAAVIAERASWISDFPRIWQSILSNFSSRFVFRPHCLQIFCCVCFSPKVWSMCRKWLGAYRFRAISSRSSSFSTNSEASFCCHTSNSSLRHELASTNARGSKHRPLEPSSRWLKVR